MPNCRDCWRPPDPSIAAAAMLSHSAFAQMLVAPKRWWLPRAFEKDLFSQQQIGGCRSLADQWVSDAGTDGFSEQRSAGRVRERRVGLQHTRHRLAVAVRDQRPKGRTRVGRI